MANSPLLLELGRILEQRPAPIIADEPDTEELDVDEEDEGESEAPAEDEFREEAQRNHQPVLAALREVLEMALTLVTQLEREAALSMSTFQQEAYTDPAPVPRSGRSNGRTNGPTPARLTYDDEDDPFENEEIG